MRGGAPVLGAGSAARDDTSGLLSASFTPPRAPAGILPEPSLVVTSLLIMSAPSPAVGVSLPAPHRALQAAATAALRAEAGLRRGLHAQLLSTADSVRRLQAIINQSSHSAARGRTP